MNKQNIIIISSIEWDTVWQTQQKLAKSLSKDNNVLFFENTGIRSPNFRDIPRIKSRIINWLQSTSGFKEIAKNLIIFYPITIPFQYSKFFRFLNKHILFSKLKKWIKIQKANNIVLITFSPSPLSNDLIDLISPNVLIYYCANQMIGHNNQHKKLLKWENLLMTKADSVFVISELLKQKAQRFCNSVSKYPAGVEIDKFIKAKKLNNIPEFIRKIDKPVVGYIGAITKVFDINLVEYLIINNSNYYFIFIGPRFIDCSKLSKKKNVLLIDQVDHHELPNYMLKFNVGIIPYIINEFTNNVYSSKLNEYLSLGIPVVSTNLNEVRYFNSEHDNIIDLADDKLEFSKLLNKNINISTDIKKEQRIKTAELNSWENRFILIKNEISNLIQYKNEQQVNWIDNIKQLYKKQRYNFLKYFFYISLTLTIIFYSPLFWYLGDKLILRDEPKKSEAIVIFSGNGEASYRNPSYQKRALDGIRYFKSGYADKIFLTSGITQQIREVELIRSILISNGVPNEALTVIEEYPKNTYENVQITYNYLKKKKINKIIFITAPYHSLRSNLIWRTNYKDIEIVNPEVIDTPPKEIQWVNSYNKIKVIIYEYLAIIYNWHKGFLKIF